ncbi:MAG: hypothetical protein RL139_1490 [Gemmatimonadota bacterium]
MGRPTLRIEIKKTHDGRPSLACVRADASRTWARVHPFLPTHDLAHYAVESVLGIDDAFFGLIAQGWAIDDFASPGAVRRLPAAAMYVERIVGYVERGMAPDAAALASALALDGTTAAAPTAAGGEFPAVTETQLAAITALRAACIAEWRALPPGETMRLTFPATPA